MLTCASPGWGYAAQTYFNSLQTLNNKVPRTITKLPRVTEINILHEEIGMSLIQITLRV